MVDGIGVEALRREPEVAMVDPEDVVRMRVLAGMGWGSKRISQEVGVARNTVRRYLRGGPAAEVQERPRRRRLSEEDRREAERLFREEAGGNAVVVRDLLRARGVVADVRTIQRAVRESRRRMKARLWRRCASRRRRASRCRPTSGRRRCGSAASWCG